MRLIDADALIHELNNSHYPGAPYVDAGISIAIGKTCDAPTIEPERTGIGNNIGYADSVCPNCGRQRVEKYESGLEICEKCNWCIQTSNFWWWEVEHEAENT